MKRFLELIMALCLCVGMLAGCSSQTGEQNKATTVNTQQKTEQTGDVAQKTAPKPQTAENPDKALLKEILVTFKTDTLLQNGKQRMIVYVENKSPKIFTGDIHVTFKDSNKKQLGYDMAIVEDLGIGQKTYCNIFITPSNDINMSFEFSREYSFKESKTIKSGTLDESLSSDFSKAMHDNFGNEKLGVTSWYPCIKKIEVFADGDLYYAVTTISDSTKANQIGAIVLTSFSDIVKLSKSIVKDEAGIIIFEKIK